ncbi:MAG: PKD domain-containing protein [Flavisolibacter sp.]
MGGSGDDGSNITPYGGGANSLQRNYGDEARSEVNLDGAGNIYLASCTQSGNKAGDPGGFPVKGGFQSVNNGGSTYNQDGVVIKFNPDLSNLMFSTYIGGSGNDAAYVISLNPINNNIFIAGGTESADFPGVPANGVIGTSFNGAIDGFVSIISNDGSTLLKSSYIGTAAIDQIYGLQFDKFGFPYIMGQTQGTWPIINAAWSQARGNQFIAKLEPTLSAYVYSTTFGTGTGTPNISPVAFLVDRCENVYVSGWGGMIGQIHYPSAGTQGLPVTPDAIKPTTDVNNQDPNDGLGEDFYFFVLKKDASAQLYGSFFGQNGPLADHVDGGTSRFDKNGVIYEAICANCGSPQNVRFPTTPGSWSPSKPQGANCNLALVKIAFNLAGVQGGIQSSINGKPRDSAGCIPLTVDFTDTVQIAKSYIWDFADGSPQVTTTLPFASHTFNAVGNYRVMMISVDSSTCNMFDTSYVNIRAGNLRAVLGFNPVKLNPCDSFKYRFDNTSTAPPSRPFNNSSFAWDFGDGATIASTGTASVFHNYASPGTYNVTLIMKDTAYCNYPDTLVNQVRVAALVKARFETPPYGCAPYTAVFNNTSDAGAQFFWNFGDGTTSTDVSPIHVYNLPGTYTISLLAVDPATCNLRDSTSTTITVYSNPTANFTASPQPPTENTPISFNNLSSADAVSFKWLFGDGDSLVVNSRAVIQHEYNSTGTFNACLIAYNKAGCPDTTCRPITTLIVPAVDVPNAFTPSGSNNNIVYVRGFGIAKMKFSIYTRWGEKVFEIGDKHIGWDGRYKGQMLPMDVYAYTLNVEFTDGTKTTKTGDITLIR